MYLSYKQLLDMNGTPVYSIDLDRWVLVQVLDETFENRIILRDSRGFKWNWNHKCVLKCLSDGTRRSSLEEAKLLINEFCLREYGSTPDYSDLQNVDIAYTTTEDEQHEIQISVDLENFTIKRMLDKNIINVWRYSSLEELIESELKDLSFYDLISR